MNAHGARHFIEALGERPLILLGAGGVEILGQRAADPALDRAEEIEPGEAHELAHRILDAGRMAARSQLIGDLLVSGPFAFEQDAVEIEDQRRRLR